MWRFVPAASGGTCPSPSTGPEALPPRAFLDLLTAYGTPWGMREQ
ncbi:hypothetical protein [Microtetraspora glauca]|uniref:Uncharacterized protein n=1 Tax=Microtetraspora glauca TaxID=1996 RepID=A0ABV3GQU9_MICGL